MPATATPSRPSVVPSPAAADTERLRLVLRLADRLHASRSADPVTVRAVSVLTDAADPSKADAMRPHTGDASPLVERLSVWAVRRAGADAVAGAHALLDREAGPAPVRDGSRN